MAARNLTPFALKRRAAGYSQESLANELGHSRMTVYRWERGETEPEPWNRPPLAGALSITLDELDDLLRKTRAPGAPTDANALALVVEHEEAELTYDGAVYTAYQRRRISNNGTSPLARYLMRISVDRHPGSPERSNQLYRADPLTWDELALEAWIGEGEPLTWSVHHDRDAFKELWLLFENERGRFPLYPGESTWLHYRYRVPGRKWGDWYQRAVRVPTRHLEARLIFPADLDPMVWGLETSTAAQPLPFCTPIVEHRSGDLRTFRWSIDDPPLHARYRLEWRFRALPEGADVADTDTRRPSEIMRSLGIVQADDPDLHQPATPFDLPAEAEDARRVVAQLQSVAERVGQVHTFGKGIGLAAPQIGINRSVAIIRPPSAQCIVLVNPRIVAESAETTQLYEGCLSFFDVRGLVPRARTIEVEHQDLDGRTRITSYDGAVARLVAHEVDHLHGVVYTDRMHPGVEPIPVEGYRETGRPWPDN